MLTPDVPSHLPSPEEFEREPVPERALLGFSSFVGQYAGEHTAGTELMIGPLFIASGVSAFDVVGGLFVGNLLAVLSWVFLTAPIAVRARLTLYYQLTGDRYALAVARRAHLVPKRVAASRFIWWSVIHSATRAMCTAASSISMP